MTRSVRWGFLNPHGKGRFGGRTPFSQPKRAVANCSHTISPMLPPGENKQVIPPFAKSLWSLFNRKGRVLATVHLTWIRLATRSTLKSRKWQLTWANDTAAHYAAIHCPRRRTTGPLFAASRYTTAPISHTRPSPVARKLLLISRPVEGRRLSWPEHTVGWQLAEGCLQMTGGENRTVTVPSGGDMPVFVCLTL